MSERMTRTLYEDEDFSLVAEVIEETFFVHCYVDRYNKTVKKKIEEVFEETKEAAAFFGWDALHTYTDNPKFTKLFKGGFKINEFSHNEETYEVWRWELQQ